jgi:hypothetical protein
MRECMLRINLLPNASYPLTVGGWLGFAQRTTNLEEASLSLRRLQPLLSEQPALEGYRAEAGRLMEALERRERGSHLLLWRTQDLFGALRNDRSALGVLERRSGAVRSLSEGPVRMGPYRGDGSEALVRAGDRRELAPRPALPSAMTRTTSRSTDWVRLGGRWVHAGMEGVVMVVIGAVFFILADKESVADKADEMDVTGWFRNRFAEPWRFLSSSDVWVLQDRAEKGDGNARKRLEDLAARGDAVAAAILEDLQMRFPRNL